jgi:hypothetical protein
MLKFALRPSPFVRHLRRPHLSRRISGSLLRTAFSLRLDSLACSTPRTCSSLTGARHLYLDFNQLALALLSRQVVLDPSAKHGLIKRIFHQRRLVWLILTVAIALGIAGSEMAYSTTASTRQTSLMLREASVYIFLAMTALVAFQAVQMAVEESKCA